MAKGSIRERQRYINGKWQLCPLSYYIDKKGGRHAMKFHRCHPPGSQESPCSWTQQQAAARSYAQRVPVMDGWKMINFRPYVPCSECGAPIKGYLTICDDERCIRGSGRQRARPQHKLLVA